MKNRQTLIAVLLTTVIVGLAYLSFWFGLNEKPDDFVIATKVGRLVVDTDVSNDKFKGQDPHKDTIFDFSYDAVTVSYTHLTLPTKA